MSQTDLLRRLLTKAGNAHDLALLYDLHAPSPTPLLTPDEVLAVVRVTSMLGILEGRARKAYDAAKRTYDMEQRMIQNGWAWFPLWRDNLNARPALEAIFESGVPVSEARMVELKMRWAKYAEGSAPPMTDEQKAALLADAQSGEES